MEAAYLGRRHLEPRETQNHELTGELRRCPCSHVGHIRDIAMTMLRPQDLHEVTTEALSAKCTCQPIASFKRLASSSTWSMLLSVLCDVARQRESERDGARPSSRDQEHGRSSRPDSSRGDRWVSFGAKAALSSVASLEGGHCHVCCLPGTLSGIFPLGQICTLLLKSNVRACAWC